MCPLCSGVIDYPQLHKFLRLHHYRSWITIQQERGPRNVEASLSDVTASLHYLKPVVF